MRVKRLALIAVLIALCSGCVSHKSCRVIFTPDYTTVELSKDWYGLVPGICGFTSHADQGSTFKLAGHKAEYRDDEIRSVSIQPDTGKYDGSISILSDTKRVIVNLNRNGHPYALNGKYHFH